MLAFSELTVEFKVRPTFERFYCWLNDVLSEGAE